MRLRWTLIVLFALSALLCIAQGLIRRDREYFWLAGLFTLQAAAQFAERRR